jgi:hypothetical protein
MNRGFHNSMADMVADAGSTEAGGTKPSALAKPKPVVAVIGVPESRALPGRFPGAEPYIPATRCRTRKGVRRPG